MPTDAENLRWLIAEAAREHGLNPGALRTPCGLATVADARLAVTMIARAAGIATQLVAHVLDYASRPRVAGAVAFGAERYAGPARDADFADFVDTLAERWRCRSERSDAAARRAALFEAALFEAFRAEADSRARRGFARDLRRDRSRVAREARVAA